MNKDKTAIFKNDLPPEEQSAQDAAFAKAKEDEQEAKRVSAVIDGVLELAVDLLDVIF